MKYFNKKTPLNCIKRFRDVNFESKVAAERPFMQKIDCFRSYTNALILELPTLNGPSLLLGYDEGMIDASVSERIFVMIMNLKLAIGLQLPTVSTLSLFGIRIIVVLPL